MTEPVRTTGSRFARIGVASAITIAMAAAAVACSDDSGDAVPATGSDSSAIVGTSPGGGGDAGNGEELARSEGCAGCHGSDFDGGAGPGWVGLAGSDRTLADGTVVVADTAYLTRAIADPAADLVADYTLRMPANGLSDEEVADVVAFIETLANG